jgi:hypothetical protein
MTTTAVTGDDDYDPAYTARLSEDVREVRAHVNRVIDLLRTIPGGVLAEAPDLRTRTTAAPPPTAALAQWERERAALIQCARALAFGYAGTLRPPETEPEDRAMWDAMHAAYNALGVTDTRNLSAS